MSAAGRARSLALVTGGLRRLGAVIAGRLAAAGYDLALASHGSGQPEADLGDARWVHFAVDLETRGSSEALIADVIAHFGRAPDLLVNNAARFDQDDIATIDLAALEVHFRLNHHVPLLLAKALVAAAPAELCPCVVNIIDQRVRNPVGDQLSYTLSKQALAEQVRTLALALAPRARVNGVAPGLVIATAEYAADRIDIVRAAMPLGFLPGPSDVADAVLYLAGARSVTGQVVFVDAGAHLKSFDRDFLFLGSG